MTVLCVFLSVLSGSWQTPINPAIYEKVLFWGNCWCLPSRNGILSGHIDSCEAQ